MTAAARNGEVETRRQWGLWLIAVAAALALAAGLFKIQQLPSAQSIASADGQLTAGSSQALALYNLRAAPVMSYQGATGAGLTVRASTARLAPATRKKLFMFGAQLPNVRGAPVEWRARPSAIGRISVLIGNQRQSSDAGMMLSVGGGVPAVKIRAVQTVLTAQFVVADPAAETGVDPELRFGDLALTDPALAAMRVEIEIPPGETMTMEFDSPQALSESRFSPGELPDAQGGDGGLGIGRAEVGQPAASNSYPRLVSVSEALCASRAGRLLFTRDAPTPDDCRLGKDRTRDTLAAKGIAVEPQAVALTLAGSGFVMKDGRSGRGGLDPALIANPLVAAGMAVLACAIAWPLWRLWKGRGR